MGVGVMQTEHDEKVVGLMQSADTATLMITELLDGETYLIRTDGEPKLYIAKDEFNRLTVHEILNKAGVPIK